MVYRKFTTLACQKSDETPLDNGYVNFSKGGRVRSRRTQLLVEGVVVAATGRAGRSVEVAEIRLTIAALLERGVVRCSMRLASCLPSKGHWVTAKWAGVK